MKPSNQAHKEVNTSIPSTQPAADEPSNAELECYRLADELQSAMCQEQALQYLLYERMATMSEEGLGHFGEVVERGVWQLQVVTNDRLQSAVRNAILKIYPSYEF